MHLLHYVRQRVKDCLERSSDYTVATGKVRQHDFPRVLQFVVSSEKGLRQRELHVIELAARIGHLPEDVLHILEAHLTVGDTTLDITCRDLLALALGIIL